ncbi:dihydropteridine reductase-like isoform X3 [Amphibalanus amphitrite]|uniref:dihydropteridine reductase-like isoform X3 n=1 Tax=Amphibalanus amphitrite TaxID=1232801 RepID=UPI001C919E91|nr:dihydropteridine reductase-like isoform X3 [Amphibalanus amphitrite]
MNRQRRRCECHRKVRLGVDRGQIRRELVPVSKILRNHVQTKWVGSVDLAPNEEADVNVLVRPADSWEEQLAAVLEGVEGALAGEKLDAIFCVAGGWAGGSAKAKAMVKNCDLMWKQSVWSSAISAHLASRVLREGGLLQLTGAQPALGPTPGMMGYGMAKAAVHQLVRSLGAEESGLPPQVTALAILPVTLDTPMNRKFMPDADHTTWTPMEYVAGLFGKWAEGDERPKTGSLVQLITKDSKTELVNAD